MKGRPDRIAAIWAQKAPENEVPPQRVFLQRCIPFGGVVHVRQDGALERRRQYGHPSGRGNRSAYDHSVTGVDG
jgi:hypothetical protein